MSSGFFRMATFEERLVAAFDGANLKSIAEKMDVNYHTLRNWAKETRDIPPSELKKIARMTPVSLNWLLLEEGPRTIRQLGFDLDYSVTRNEDWQEILEEWYDFEGRVMPDFGGVAFMGGWESFTHKQRVAAITDLKMMLDRTVDRAERTMHSAQSGKVAATIERPAAQPESNRDVEYVVRGEEEKRKTGGGKR